MDMAVTEQRSQLLDVFRLTEAQCLSAFCDATAKVLGADTVLLASLGLVESEHFFVEAVSSNAAQVNTSQFCAASTPCAEVITTDGPFYVCSDVCATYPDARILQQLSAEAYLGLPLRSPDRAIIGVIVMLWQHSVETPSMQSSITAIDPYLTRIAHELTHKIKAHVLPALVSPSTPMSPHKPADVFQHIVEQASMLTKVSTVAIVHREAQEFSRFCILAISSEAIDVKEMQGSLIDYAGIPCSNMIANDVFQETSGVLEKYPGMPLLELLGVESYLGFGFRNTAGETIGHIAFLHNRAMRPSAKTCKVMNVIASRVGQELHRYTLECEKDSMQAALRVRTKLESLGAMAGTIAHDFNNQLTVMIGNTDLAMTEIPQDHPAHRYLSRVEESMWRARDVISEIMDFAGNSANAPSERVALGELVASVISEFEQRSNDESQIVSKIEPKLPDIESRRIQIFQILSNLISNGLEALQEGASQRLYVTVSTVVYPTSDRKNCLTGQSQKLPDRCVRIELRDTGIGVSPDIVERVFDPYFSTKGVSRGLGLSSVLGIAKRLGIGLTFESKPGVGTTFRLFFAPAEKLTEEAKLVDDAPMSGYVSARKTALIVDDDASVNDTVSQMLHKWGWHVVKVYSGEEAITLHLSNHRFDLAFLDVVMPGINGFETLSELRKFDPELPAVIVSGYSEDSLSKSHRTKGKVKFLKKPFGAKLLKNAIDEVLSEEQLVH